MNILKFDEFDFQNMVDNLSEELEEFLQSDELNEAPYWEMRNKRFEEEKKKKEQAKQHTNRSGKHMGLDKLKTRFSSFIRGRRAKDSTAHAVKTKMEHDPKKKSHSWK